MPNKKQAAHIDELAELARAEGLDDYTSEHRVGEDNIKTLGLDVHNPVFLISGSTIVLVVVFALALPGLAADVFGQWRVALTTQLDWFFMAVANLVLLFCLFLVLSPLGAVRLGGPDARPRYGYASWIAMLFAAGIGIGIMFYGVLEPMTHALTPPLSATGVTGAERRGLAMAATIYHWAFHPWAVYSLVGLSLAFFSFNKGLPLVMRSALYPVFGERIWGWPGHVVDVLAVFATLFGLATSLGFGAEQAAGGIAYLFGIPNANWLRVAVISLITFLALGSVLRGLDGGIKLLSELNMGAAAVLGVFVLALGPTWDILSGLVQYSGAYLRYLPELSNWVGREDDYYMHNWTTFYWAWWIAFSPFVGMFIARISSGRTVREFIVAALLAPSAIFILWMTIFGETAMNQYFLEGWQGVAKTVREFEPELSLFVFLERFPLTLLTSALGVLLVLVFFVTSMDSGSLIVDTMTAGGKIETPVGQRIFWCIFLGLLGVALMLGGGLNSLQALALASAFPFSLVMLLMMVSLYRGLRAERLLLAVAEAESEAEAELAVEGG
ncbi:BCCT family transporter [Pseudohaliea rubra]|uniref:High-affinity choline uptake protein BetT n=1 Tax=Pseudohaliea rubra DSM 19751 TaxID=1265313 RepID=A0A095VTC0_9GAMM|nr:BCCT family transporter [Pseudohaliea rubra]KGE04585.1 High-affinity choline uptake protein BetT [Pseudohaliea rubra DSM 19751]